MYTDYNFKCYPAEKVEKLKEHYKHPQIDESLERIDRELEIHPHETDRRRSERKLRNQIQSCLELKEEPDDLLMTINDYKLFSCRSINLIYGQTSTAKSTLAHCVVISLISEDGIYEDLKLRKATQKNVKVVWIDSELSTNEFTKARNKILKNSNCYPEDLRLLPIRIQNIEPKERVDAIVKVVDLVCRDFPSTHVVVLVDTITDLVRDYNSLEESENAVKSLLSIIDRKDCTIIGVMHQTDNFKGKSKPIGHFGSALNRKCSSILRISKNSGSFKIYNEKNRNQKEFESIDAEFGENTSLLRIMDVQSESRVAKGLAFEDAFYQAFKSLSQEDEVPLSAVRIELPEILNCSGRTISNFIKNSANKGKYIYQKSGKGKNQKVTVRNREVE